jgi:hypothetical protein
MKNKYQKFVLQLTILSLIAGIAAYLLYLVLPDRFITPALPYLFILFYIPESLSAILC